MRLFVTEIRAIDPMTGEMKLWAGPYVPGISFADADNYCRQHSLGYCKVTGILESEVPQGLDGGPDWHGATKYNFEDN